MSQRKKKQSRDKNKQKEIAHKGKKVSSKGASSGNPPTLGESDSGSAKTGKSVPIGIPISEEEFKKLKDNSEKR